MTDAQAAITEVSARKEWLATFQGRTKIKDVIGRWYMPNTRECIRDETLRTMVDLNAVIARPGVTTTSPKPRYSLQEDFANLFNPSLDGEGLNAAIEKWQEHHLSAAARARTALSKKMVTKQSGGVLVNMPNGEIKKISAGPSAELTKAVVEIFAHNFLREPAVLLMSESARKLTMTDDEVCKSIGFKIDVTTVLPDLILADLGQATPQIVFVECVATDGPIHSRRKQELIKTANDAGYRAEDCAFVTVFRDRAGSESRRLSPTVAWGTFIWHATEPSEIIYLRNGVAEKLVSLGDILKL